MRLVYALTLLIGMAAVVADHLSMQAAQSVNNPADSADACAPCPSAGK